MITTSFRGIVAAAALLAGVATLAEAQVDTPSRFGIKAGVAVPLADFGDFAGIGVHAGAQLGFTLTENWGLRFDADYGHYSGEGTVDNTTLLGGMASLVYNIPTDRGSDPYLFGGLGFYNYEIEGGGISDEDSDMAYNVGIGYDFNMGEHTWFAELRFLSIQTEGDALNTLPIVVGFRF